MMKLYLGLVLFGGPHLFSMVAPEARGLLAERLGENAYKGLYSLLSLVGLVLLGWAYVASRGVDGSFYDPTVGGRHLAMMLVLLGFILISSNANKGYIQKTVRHPFSAGIALWSLGHLVANGEKTVVMIFAMFLVLALLDIGLCLARGKVPSHVPDARKDVRSVIIGVGLYLVFLFGFHPYVLRIAVV